MYKNCDARVKLLFSSLNLLFFMTFSLPSATLDLWIKRSCLESVITSHSFAKILTR